ncbi:MAG TPA: M23 family metallopeptidase [Pyrinomonadaceae bacterium]|jgi:murein DD-endopeptidase MepM/ murein hydrolase activator NlpD
MPVYPLAKKVESYKTVAPAKFNAPRGGGARKHAGIDMGIGAGSSVYAMAKGTVLEASSTGFYVDADKGINVGVVSIKHDVKITIGGVEYDSFVVRYGEVDTVKVSKNASVDEGDLIALVAKQADEGTELHLELYLGEQGITSASVFKSSNPPYMRAFTPSDPTALVDSLNVK